MIVPLVQEDSFDVTSSIRKITFALIEVKSGLWVHLPRLRVTVEENEFPWNEVAGEARDSYISRDLLCDAGRLRGEE